MKEQASGDFPSIPTPDAIYSFRRRRKTPGKQFGRSDRLA
jgi:hypothetical protein